MFQGFEQIFSKKLQKLWHFVKNHQDVSISSKLATFCAKYHVLGFEHIFSKKFQKLWHFVKNHQNVSISSKLATFCAKCHVLGFLPNFQQKLAKSIAFCKKTIKTCRSLQNQQLFVQTSMFQGFEQIFSKNLQKLWHFVKNHQNVSISPKLATFLCKLQCLRVLTKVSAKSCKNYGILRKTTKTCRSRQNQQLFCANYNVLGF